jgi:hypothetical protein
MGIGFSTKIAGRYARVVDQGVERWLQALIAANAGAYTSNRFVSDVVAHSAEVGAAWAFTFKSLFPQLNPVVRFDIKANVDNPPPSATSIPPIPPVVLAATNLTKGVDVIPAAAHVSAVLASTGDQVVVTLKALQTVASPLPTGLYTGSVKTPANVKVADIQLNVS